MTKEEELKQKRFRKLEEVHGLLEELGESQKPFIHERKEVDIVETIKVIYLIYPRSMTIFLERTNYILKSLIYNNTLMTRWDNVDHFQLNIFDYSFRFNILSWY